MSAKQRCYEPIVHVIRNLYEVRLLMFSVAKDKNVPTFFRFLPMLPLLVLLQDVLPESVEVLVAAAAVVVCFL